MNFYRSVRSRDLLQIFFVSAITSLLLVRFYLYLAGYPQLGSGNFHIAHMLWGGLLMLMSMSLLLGFIGKRVQQLAALLGGLGFGVFIDEIGKFITRDNDYFFKPTVGIIYAIFVVLFLAFSFISRGVTLSSREYQLNALAEFEEAVSKNMDESEKNRVRALLLNAEQDSPVTKQLLKLLDSIKTSPLPSTNRFQKLLIKTDDLYRRFWHRRNSNSLVNVFFIGQALLFLITIIVLQYTSVDDVLAILRGEITYGRWLLIGEIISALVALLIVLRATYIMARSRLEGFELLRKAILINIFLTQFFSFSRVQFEALPGFTLNVVLFIFIGYIIHQERKFGAQ